MPSVSLCNEIKNPTHYQTDNYELREHFQPVDKFVFHVAVDKYGEND